MKRTSDKIVSDIKKSKIPKEKRNYTFRLNVEIMDKFVGKCDKKGVKQTDVIHELLKDFASE